VEDQVVGEILRASFGDAVSSDPVTYYRHVGDIYSGVAYSYLFWPNFMVVEGAVFVAMYGDDESHINMKLAEIRGGETGLSHDWGKIVDSFNWFEISQFFPLWRGPGEHVETAFRKLGEVLCKCWAAKLCQDFPDRTFEVALNEADENVEINISVRQTYPPLVDVPWLARSK
jgi:hypothetical protein